MVGLVYLEGFRTGATHSLPTYKCLAHRLV